MTQPTRPAARPGLVMAIVLAGVVLTQLDLFVVNVALPDIGTDFHVSLSHVSWVLNGYTIVFASLLVPLGRLADRGGRRGGYLLGLGVFTVASALCALAPGADALVAARVLQAAGAALLVPTSLSLVLAAYPPERRTWAVRVWTAVGGAAAALGPALGGVLVQASWRWAFVINLPLGVVALVLGLRALPRLPAEGGRVPDLLAAGLLTLGIASLTTALVRGPEWGWTSGRDLAAFAVAVLALLAFVARTPRHPSPVVEPVLLRQHGYTLAVVASLLYSVAFAAMLLSVTLWLQTAWGYSALRTGLGVAAGPAMVPLVTVASSGLVRRLGQGKVIALGCLVFAAGAAWWAVAMGPRPAYAAELLPGMLLTGIGVGLALPNLFAAAAASLPPARFATGSAVLNMGRQVGFSLGVAGLVAVLGRPVGTGVLRAFQHGWWGIAGTSLVAGAVALRLRRPALEPAPAAEPVARDAASV